MKATDRPTYTSEIHTQFVAYIRDLLDQALSAGVSDTARVYNEKTYDVAKGQLRAKANGGIKQFGNNEILKMITEGIDNYIKGYTIELPVPVLTKLSAFKDLFNDPKHTLPKETDAGYFDKLQELRQAADTRVTAIANAFGKGEVTHLPKALSTSSVGVRPVTPKPAPAPVAIAAPVPVMSSSQSSPSLISSTSSWGSHVSPSVSSSSYSSPIAPKRRSPSPVAVQEGESLLGPMVLGMMVSELYQQLQKALPYKKEDALAVLVNTLSLGDSLEDPDLKPIISRIPAAQLNSIKAQIDSIFETVQDLGNEGKKELNQLAERYSLEQLQLMNGRGF